MIPLKFRGRRKHAHTHYGDLTQSGFINSDKGPVTVISSHACEGLTLRKYHTVFLGEIYLLGLIPFLYKIITL